MGFNRFTKENPNVHPMQKTSYHIPMSRVDNIEMKTFGSNIYMYGQIPEKLGKYEDLGEPEEIAKRLGMTPRWLKQ